jgi:hypothetical protein
MASQPRRCDSVVVLTTTMWHCRGSLNLLAGRGLILVVQVVQVVPVRGESGGGEDLGAMAALGAEGDHVAEFAV